MKDSVREAFVDFTAHFEGVVATMYLDVKGLVTIGIGNLIDPMVTALSLPFLHGDNTFASSREIADEWQLIKSHTELAAQGWKSAAKMCQLHLSPEGIGQLVGVKLAQNEKLTIARWPRWNEWPADAQLGVMSMAWAAGPMFRFPMFSAAALEQDFAECARQCRLDETGNPGLKPRNVANVTLFRNAAWVVSNGLDRDVLHYPTDLCGAPSVPDVGA